MISEESCDTEDWRLAAENNKKKTAKQKVFCTVIVFHNITDLLYCIFDQINAALVKHNILNSSTIQSHKNDIKHFASFPQITHMQV